MVFRGFLIQVGTRLLGERYLWPITVGSAAVFGLSHLYQGLSGVFETGAIGLLLAVVFVASRRDLMLTMLVHGFVNTISLSLMYFGLIG
ncbi:MAG: CPBP family intramembrane glutamic endopeptidase [Pseudomonadota bacterium]